MKKELLKIDDARIIFRNFSGIASKFNREGDRNFCVVIEDPNMAQQLAEDGWNIKIRPPRDEGDNPFHYLPVKVKFGEYPPNVYLASGKKMVKLDEESVDCLDDVDIISVDMDIRPYDWEVNDKTGRTAYLRAIKVTQQIDRFAVNHTEENPGDPPF